MKQLKVKIFADGAKVSEMVELASKPHISGLTTNPTLMKKAGISDYRKFAQEVLEKIPHLPISFEVFADDFQAMKEQALEIKSWGENVYVKIPVMNTKKIYSYELITDLTQAGIKLNVTALFTLNQVRETVQALKGTPGAYVSVFAGRIADTGKDPVPLMKEALAITRKEENAELLWASPRELFNIIQANEMGCDVITVGPDILSKLSNLGKDLEEFSLETVKMFYNDALAAGFKI